MEIPRNTGMELRLLKFSPLAIDAAVVPRLVQVNHLPGNPAICQVIMVTEKV